MAKITWKIEDCGDITAEAKDGITLMEVATDNGVPYIWGESAEAVYPVPSVMYLWIRNGFQKPVKSAISRTLCLT